MNSSNPIYSTLSELILSDQIYKEKAEMLFKFISYIEDYDALGTPGIFVMTRPRGFGLSLITQAITNLIKENKESESTISLSRSNKFIYKLDTKSNSTNTVKENNDFIRGSLDKFDRNSIFSDMVDKDSDNLNTITSRIEDSYIKSDDNVKEEIEAIKSFYNIGQHPLITIDFKRLEAKNAKEFNSSLLDILQELFWLNHIESHIDPFQTPKVFLQKLICEFYKKYKNKKIVILIDNYDIPFLVASKFPKDQAQEAICDYLDMLNILKYSNSYVKWCLLTGHIKFTLATEISEGLPLVNDLSFKPEFSRLFGLTTHDIKDIYQKEITKFSAAKGMTFDEYVKNLEKCYGGFLFSDDSSAENKMYCPACIAHCMTNNGEFLPYSASGKYPFLVNALSKNANDLDWLYEKDGQDPLFSNSIDITIKGKQLGTLLIQLGFATRTRVNINSTESYTTWRYRFEFPNLDMKKTFEVITKKCSIEEIKQPLVNKEEQSVTEDK